MSEVKFSLIGMIKKKIIKQEEKAISFIENFCKKNTHVFYGFGYTKYQIMAFYKTHLQSVYFRNELLNQFLNNPLYNFRWHSYRGYLTSNEKSHDNITIKNICLAYDLASKEPIVSIFLYELIKQDKPFQYFIERYEPSDSYNLEILKQTIKNLIYGERYNHEELDVYNIILSGVEIVNNQTQMNYKQDLFLSIKDISDFEHYHPLFIPSKMNYYLFVLEFSKILVESINSELVKEIVMDKGLYSNKAEMKDLPFSKLCSQMVNLEHSETIMAFLKEITKIRNIPAHDFYKNEFDSNFWKLQDEILIFGYQYVNAFIIYFTKNELPSKYQHLATYFGTSGKIGYGYGFNHPPYSIYDGQLYYVCEQTGQKDAEFLIAFKDDIDQVESLVKLITSKRPDLDPHSIHFVVNKIFKDEFIIADEQNLKSFFKGYILSNENIFEKEKYIKKGIEYFTKFTSKYPLNNIYLFADTTDPSFSSFSECTKENKLTGRGYITELLRCYKGNNEQDTLITTPFRNNKIQILSNIWD